MASKNYITPKGFQKLKEEYHQLFHVERPRLVETVAWAASNGDRSENADYIYGKRRLREIDRRLGILSKRLEDAEVVDVASQSSTKVLFGATVKLEDEEGELVEYTIVGEDESEPEKSRISWVSPLAKALLGREEGDEVSVQRPAGEKLYTIREVKYGS